MTRRWRRRGGAKLVVGLALVAVVAGGCSTAEGGAAPAYEGYQPATVGSAGTDGTKPVTLTEDAVRRIGLQTATVTTAGSRLQVPYAALVYDPKGQVWVYTVPQPLSYRRVLVTVASIEDTAALLAVGPPAGTEVVTQGATELYGAELGMAGKH